MNILSFTKWLLTHPLNRQTPWGPLRAVNRFLRWQLASRLMANRIALPFVDKTFLLVERGMTGATGNWYCGLHEPSEMAFVLHALRREDLFVDVGANIGSYSILAAGAVGATAICIEPIPNTFLHLAANVRLNNLVENTILHNVGLSSENGRLKFTRCLDTMNRLTLPDETINSLDVPVRTLDDLLMGQVPQIIKIDVEGHELSVLRGAPVTLKRPELRAVIMETNQSGLKYGVNDAELIGEMSDYGFYPYIYDGLARKLSPATNDAVNLIFIRDPESISQMCKAAGKFELNNGAI